jgi:hypothetical protein
MKLSVATFLSGVVLSATIATKPAESQPAACSLPNVLSAAQVTVQEIINVFGNETMISCIYTGSTMVITGAVGLNVKCPTGKMLTLPGYDTGTTETTLKVRVVGLIPKVDSGSVNQLDLALAVGGVTDFQFKTFAVCG